MPRNRAKAKSDRAGFRLSELQRLGFAVPYCFDLIIARSLLGADFTDKE